MVEVFIYNKEISIKLTLKILKLDKIEKKQLVLINSLFCENKE